MLLIDHQQHGMRCLLMYCLGGPEEQVSRPSTARGQGKQRGQTITYRLGRQGKGQARQRQRARALRTRIRRVLLKVTGGISHHDCRTVAQLMAMRNRERRFNGRDAHRQPARCARTAPGRHQAPAQPLEPDRLRGAAEWPHSCRCRANGGTRHR